MISLKLKNLKHHKTDFALKTENHHLNGNNDQARPRMPGSLSGSYRSLVGSSDVYRSTTVSGGGPTAATTGIFEGMKKAFSFMAGRPSTTKEEKLIERVDGGGPVIVSSRYSNFS